MRSVELARTSNAIGSYRERANEGILSIILRGVTRLTKRNNCEANAAMTKMGR